MRRSIIFLCILGFTTLIVGSVLAIPPLRERISPTVSIPCSGTIRYSDNAEPQEPTSTTTLDKIGYLTILASIGLFAIAFLRSRKPT